MIPTHYEVVGKHLFEGSKKNYKSSKRKIKEKRTEEYKAAYLNVTRIAMNVWIACPTYEIWSRFSVYIKSYLAGQSRSDF